MRRRWVWGPPPREYLAPVRAWPAAAAGYAPARLIGMEPVLEWPYTCPFCWEQNTVLIDLSAPPDSMIEDCSVCCRPILLEVSVSGDGVESVRAIRGD